MQKYIASMVFPVDMANSNRLSADATLNLSVRAARMVSSIKGWKHSGSLKHSCSSGNRKSAVIPSPKAN